MDIYEKQIKDYNKKLKALIKTCNTDNHKLINYIEKIDNKNWLKVSYNYDLNTLPKNYFDIILWSGCDIEAELKNIPLIDPILRPGAHIYFDNLLPAFKELMKSCLPENSIDINDESVVLILKEIFPNYDIKLIEYGVRYIVIVKPLPDIRKLIIANIHLGEDEIKELIPYNTNFTSIINDIKKEYEELNNIIKSFVEKGEVNILKKIKPSTDFVDIAKQLIKIYEQKFVEKPLPPALLPGLKNVGGFSCYMDSVLLSILLPQDGYFIENICNKPITQNIANICSSIKQDEQMKYMKDLQQTFKNIRNKILSKSGGTCTPLVSKIKKCNDLTRNLMSGDQQDDSEFLISVMNIFNLLPTKINHIIQVSQDGTNWDIIRTTEEKQAVLEVRIFEINNDILKTYETITEMNYSKLPQTSYPEFDNNRYAYIREQSKIISSKEIILHVPRLQIQNGRYVKDTRKVSFCPYLQQSDTVFELYAVTIHSGNARGGHYTAYFKYTGQWFYYDDTQNNIIYADWDSVLDNASEHGSLFFYRKLS